MIGVGTVLTRPLLVAAGVVAAVLLGIVIAEAGALWWLNHELEGARADYATLQRVNARCEAESSALRGAVGRQNEAVAAVQKSCATAADASKKALAEALAGRGASEARVAGILAGKPTDPADLCKSACVELLKERR